MIKFSLLADVISNLDYSRMSSKTKSSSVFHFSKKLEDKVSITCMLFFVRTLIFHEFLVFFVNAFSLSIIRRALHLMRS